MHRHSLSSRGWSLGGAMVHGPMVPTQCSVGRCQPCHSGTGFSGSAGAAEMARLVDRLLQGAVCIMLSAHSAASRHCPKQRLPIPLDCRPLKAQECWRHPLPTSP